MGFPVTEIIDAKILPLSVSDWHLTRAYKMHHCNETNTRIFPLTAGYRRSLYYGILSGNEMLAEEWLTPTAYMFRKLKGTL